MAEAKTETKAKKPSAASKATGTTPAKKAPSAKAATAPRVAAVKKATTPRASSKTQSASMKVTPEQRYMMICEAAYFNSERRGFSPEHEVQDWLDAEAEINRLLGM